MISRSSPSVAEFVKKGFAARKVFPHRADVIRKHYPDTLLQFERRGMAQSELRASRLCQLNLYSDHLAGLPDQLFTDTALNWHNQQLGEKGLIAAAGLAIQDSALMVTLMQSDLCQQLFRHAEFKLSCRTVVEKRFTYWYRLLFNAILDFAMENGITAVYSPTAEWIQGATKRLVQPELFQRIYNTPGRFYIGHRVTRQRAEYWEIPMRENADRVVRLTPASVPPPPAGRRICIFHDTEENVDTAIPAEECRRNLTAMLSIEKEFGCCTTYTVLGNLLRRSRDEIRAAGPHCLAFHSYDHDLSAANQLERCRTVDLQVKGYRTPRSVITPELSDDRLSYYNFEWLASSGRSLGHSAITLENGIVKIPISTDDYSIATGRIDFPEWRRRLLDSAADSSLLAFGLHDCYAGCWLDAYPSLLESLAALGTFVTADELCGLTFRQQG